MRCYDSWVYLKEPRESQDAEQADDVQRPHEQMVEDVVMAPSWHDEDERLRPHGNMSAGSMALQAAYVPAQDGLLTSMAYKQPLWQHRKQHSSWHEHFVY